MTAPIAQFWHIRPGDTIQMGTDARRQTVSAPTSGILGFLPGLPPRTITDRQGYVQARVNYLNHLFSSNAYLVAAANNRHLRNLQVLIPRVIVLVKGKGVHSDALGTTLLASLPITPLEAHDVPAEYSKIGTDMYIALALANLRIYLLGGIVLAMIAIVAIGMANYAEDRRTLALLRIRGASPARLWRFLVAMLLSPALLGLILGGAVAIAAGFGLASHLWSLREIRTVVQLLPTRLVMSPLTGAVGVGILGLLLVVASGFSWWEYRRTAQENVRG